MNTHCQISMQRQSIRGHSQRVARACAAGLYALAELVACHQRPDKWLALYQLLWSLVHEGRDLLDDDPRDDVRTVKEMAAQVRSDEHKMRACVRFVPVTDDAGERYVAWYEPDHLIVRLAASFFADRSLACRSRFSRQSFRHTGATAR